MLKPSVVLTFLAPADRCNQHCPKCILDIVDEPVRDFDLQPADYARFVEDFVKRDIPIRSISFQGYEVTLPSAWRYVEPVFFIAKRYGLRKGFITNGMLLHRWTDRIVALEPHRISVSLDGSSPAVNDPIRGLEGAFDATVTSIRRFLAKAPQFQPNMAVASCLYHEENYRSLLAMPRLLEDLGISRWTLGFELEVAEGRERPAHSRERLLRWSQGLQEAARARGIRVHLNDEMGFFKNDPEASNAFHSLKHVHNAPFLYRVMPTGHVRVGSEILDRWDSSKARRWNPATDSAVDVVGYWNAARKWRQASGRQDTTHTAPGR